MGRLLSAGLLVAGWLVRSIACLEPLERVRVDPHTGLFRDASGRARLFHGVNVVYKIPPWYPPSDSFSTDGSLDSETIGLMRKWGFNAVRFGIMWPGVEPSPGNIDEGYLREVKRLAAELSRGGIYTIADLHQDLGTRRFCGEGFPEQYVDALLRDPGSLLARAAPFPAPLRYAFTVNASNAPPPLNECLQHNFGNYYATEAAGALWEELYTPGSDLRKGFLRYWGAVAGALTGLPYVLGYELLNEPSGLCLGGNALSCANLPLTSRVEAEKLTPLYREAAKVIRAVDKDTPLLYEPTMFPKVGDVFPEPPLGDDPQQGLAYHIYCAPGDDKSIWTGAGCKLTQDLFTRSYFGFLRKHKQVGGFMTEFGAIAGSQRELIHLDRLLGMADNELQSWTYWQLKKFKDFTTANAAESLYDEHGDLNVPKLKSLSRTYAQAVAGTPTKMSFDPSTADFELTFFATITDAPTVVYLNEELFYPNGYTCRVQPPSCLRRQQGEPHYLQLHLEDAACKGKSVTVQIRRKSPRNSTLVI